MSEHRAQGKLGAGVKMGVLVNDADPQLPRVADKVVKPMLKAWGVPFEEQHIARSSDISGAVLRYATAGVNRVIFLSPNGLNQLQFMNLAENQGYRPQYSFWDPDSPKFVGETAPEAQSRNISGIGALPVSDVAPSQHPSPPEEQRCLKVLKDGGEESADRNSNLAATLYCEAFWAFEAVAEKVQGGLSPVAWRAAYPTLGTAYRPVSTFATDFGTGRHDNASLYKVIQWSDGCSCMTFVGPTKPIPR